MRAAVDWRRSGLTHPIPKSVLATPAMASIYLADRPEEPRTQEALDKGLEWATEEINETVALLGRRFPDPTDPTVEAFEAFDYLVDHLTEPALLSPSSCGNSASTRRSPPSGSTSDMPPTRAPTCRWQNTPSAKQPTPAKLRHCST